MQSHNTDYWLQMLDSDDPGLVAQAAWVMGRRRVSSAASRLWRRATDPGLDNLQSRRLCLEAWLETQLLTKIKESLDWSLLAAIDPSLVVSAVQHPRWLADRAWLDDLTEATHWGQDSRHAVWTVWAWSDRAVPALPLPLDLRQRCGISEQATINWDAVWQEGILSLLEGESWDRIEVTHAKTWAGKCLHYMQAECIYYRTRNDENILDQWLNKPIGPLLADPKPQEWVTLPMPTGAIKALTVIGLGLAKWSDHFGEPDFSAWWDGVWASWAASLQYALYEIYSNIQITEWHLGGLTGMLANSVATDSYSVPRPKE